MGLGTPSGGNIRTPIPVETGAAAWSGAHSLAGNTRTQARRRSAPHHMSAHCVQNYGERCSVSWVLTFKSVPLTWTTRSGVATTIDGRRRTPDGELALS